MGAVGKHTSIDWLAIYKAAFDKLKSCLTQAPLLQSWHKHYPTCLNTNTSDLVIGREVEQLAEDDLWHPITYESQTLIPVEQNYPAQEQELLVILHCWRKFNHWLDGASDSIMIYTDHASLLYLHQ